MLRHALWPWSGCSETQTQPQNWKLLSQCETATSSVRYFSSMYFISLTRAQVPHANCTLYCILKVSTGRPEQCFVCLAFSYSCVKGKLCEIRQITAPLRAPLKWLPCPALVARTLTLWRPMSVLSATAVFCGWLVLKCRGFSSCFNVW